ncbi:MAG TPA: VOC family protein [Conexibacter sp.]|nr:VOC family protein [Conexibacter sp.]
MSLSPATSVGPVRLTVANTTGVGAFYERVVGLRPFGPRADDSVVRLGAGADDLHAPPLVELVGDPSAPARARHSSGLFHLALLVPDRASLARALRRIVAGGWRLDGASDHLVSEALYLSDPEGNGIELYRDRPRAEWRRDANGELAMATLPLDLRDLAGELTDKAPERDAGMPAGTVVGHVHLEVADLAAAEGFYAGALGFDVMVRGYPGALFVAAGGYHHHLGLNTWASAGGPPRDPAARGLRDYAIVLPDAAQRDATAARVADAGHPVAADDDSGDAIATDPFGIDVRLRAA